MCKFTAHALDVAPLPTTHPHAPSVSASQPLCHRVGWSTRCICRILLHCRLSQHTSECTFTSHISCTHVRRHTLHINSCLLAPVSQEPCPTVQQGLALHGSPCMGIKGLCGRRRQWHTLFLDGTVQRSLCINTGKLQLSNINNTNELQYLDIWCPHLL